MGGGEMMDAPFIPNSINPAVYKEGHIWLAKCRDACNASAKRGVTYAFHGGEGANEYRNEFRFSDMEIVLDFEDNTFLDSGEEQVLDKPRLTLASESNDVDKTSEGNLLIEWMIITNRANSGRLQLEGYSQLCKYTCSDEMWWLWSEFGLLPRFCVVTKVRDGGRIDPDLRSRLLVASLMTNFSVIGEMHNGPR